MLFLFFVFLCVSLLRLHESSTLTSKVFPDVEVGARDFSLPKRYLPQPQGSGRIISIIRNPRSTEASGLLFWRPMEVWLQRICAVLFLQLLYRRAD